MNPDAAFLLDAVFAFWHTPVCTCNAT